MMGSIDEFQEYKNLRGIIVLLVLNLSVCIIQICEGRTMSSMRKPEELHHLKKYQKKNMKQWP